MAKALGQSGSQTSYPAEPAEFATKVLHLEHVWSKQRDILRAVETHDRVAVRAGRKISKSNSVAILALWWLLAREGRAFLTSSSFPQIKSILWHEIAMLAAKARLNFTIPLDPSTGIRHGKGEIVGRSTNRRENFQGYSGPDVLYIVDEASGVATEILEAIEGNCAGGGKILMLGNPTQNAGKFYDAFHTMSEFWTCLHVSSRESPNVTGEAQIPGLATPEWIGEREREYGPDSPFVQVHIDGEFPQQGARAVITLASLEAAKARYDDTPADGPPTLGVDVARFGSDESVIFPRRGRKLFEPIGFRSMDGVQVAGEVMAYVERERDAGRITKEETVTCKVDVIGYGASAYDHLKHSDRAEQLGIEAVAINVGERATSRREEGGYSKLRDQLWFGLRDWLEDGAIPAHAKFEAECVAASYDFDTQGRFKVSGKDALREILHRSTDYADAAALAVYEAQAAAPYSSSKVGKRV